MSAARRHRRASRRHRARAKSEIKWWISMGYADRYARYLARADRLFVPGILPSCVNAGITDLPF